MTASGTCTATDAVDGVYARRSQGNVSNSPWTSDVLLAVSPTPTFDGRIERPPVLLAAQSREVGVATQILLTTAEQVSLE